MSNLTELTWIAEARKYVGQRETSTNTSPFIEEMQCYMLGISSINSKHWLYKTAWCGTFIAYCLKKVNVTFPKHWYRALDYPNYATRLIRPAYGCVAVKSRKGGGHVCFVVGQTKEGKLVCLGGNQNDMVCFALYNKEDFDAFIWYGKTSNPAKERYNLPILEKVTALKVTES